ncbi:MAG TPA: histidine kinase [Flavobacteriales bacterium]|jgi:signal transduction histidine kinase|nr:histidine kinase [Flavobacteriales bacterium]
MLPADRDPAVALRLLREEMGLTRARLALIIVAFWSITTLLIFLQSSMLHAVLGTPEMALVDRIQYMLRWTLWALITPLIVWLAIRFPFERRRWPVWFGLHVCFAIGVLVLEFLVEMPIIRTIAARGFGIHDPVMAYVAPFLAKFNLYLILYFVVNGFVNVLLYFTRFRRAQVHNERLRADLSEARLQALQQQLQPHFLFNAHHAIVGLIATGERDKAITMLTQLSELLRSTMEQPEGRAVTLAEELKVLALYLAIQRTRFGDRLQVQEDVPADVLAARVPGLLLQPLVENAIRHGLTDADRTGVIVLRASRADGRLRLEVEDNGSGLPAEVHEGIGLRNTRERLDRTYAGQAELQLLPGPGGTGTLARIELPFRT